MSSQPKSSKNQHLNHLKHVQFVDLEKMHSCTGPEQFSQKVGHHRQLPPENIFPYIQNFGLKHLLSEQLLKSNRHITFAQTLIHHPEVFLNDPITYLQNDFISLDKSWLPQSKIDQSAPSDFFCFLIKNKEDKKECLTKLDLFYKQLPRYERCQGDIHLIADEMITNLIYNAPVDWFKNADQRPRSREECHVEKPCFFLSFVMEDHLYMATIDDYGHLSLDTVLKRLEKTYREGTSQSIRPEEAGGGAGIGMRLIADRADSLTFVVHRYVKTFIMVSLPLKLNKKLETLPISFHLMQKY